MDFKRYVQQMHELRIYAGVAEIPTDPYDVPVTLARRLASYAESITLAPSQQTAYDGAVKLSHEHGPCCCHCWRWTAFEGQAKYLIARRGYSARRVAEIWDLEDGCGGAA
jgi:hypothetical protein